MRYIFFSYDLVESNKVCLEPEDISYVRIQISSFQIYQNLIEKGFAPKMMPKKASNDQKHCKWVHLTSVRQYDQLCEMKA